MQFRINATDINHGMGLVSKALSAKPQKQVFDGVLLETVPEGIRMTCTNGDLTIKNVVAATVLEAGSSLLPGKLLAELARRLEGEVDVRIDSNLRAAIRASGSNTAMMGMDEEDFPHIDDVRGEFQAQLPQGSLKEAIARVIFAVSSDDGRKILTGCLVELSAEETRLVCLDGFRLALQRIYVQQDLPAGRENVSAIVPGTVMEELGRMLEGNDEPVTLDFSASHMMASFGKTRLYTPLIIGEFINYRQILPATWMTAIRVNRTEFARSMERAALIAKEGNKLLKLNLSEEGMHISANAEQGSALEKLAIDFDGAPLTIAFNERYLMDVIKNIDSPEISMRFNTNVSPCTICPVTGNQYTYLVLPVRSFE